MNLFEITANKQIVIEEDFLKKFGKQDQNEKTKKSRQVFTSILNQIIEQNKNISFSPPDLYPQFLDLSLKGNFLDDQKKKTALSFFRSRLGLPGDSFAKDVELKGKEGASILCSKFLLETLFDYFSRLFTSKFKENFADSRGKYTINLQLGKKALDGFINYVLTEKIDVSDNDAFLDLIEFASMIDDQPFQEAIGEAVFAYLLDDKNRLQFDEQLLGGHGDAFLTEYCKKRNIPFIVKSNSRTSIFIHDFLTIFKDQKNIKLLQFLSKKINEIILPNNDFSQLIPLCSVPKQYRNGIKYLSVGKILFENYRNYVFFFPNTRNFTSDLVDRHSVEEALQKDPEDTEALALLGKLLIHSDYDKAKSLLKKAIDLDPENIFAHELLGNALAQKGQLDEAEALLKKAIELNPQSVFAHEALGDLLVQKNQLDVAETLLKKAIELDPESAFALESLGNILRKKDQLDEAEALLKKAIELNPHSPFAHEALGKVLSEKDQLDEAETHFKRAIELDPESAFALESLGNILRKKDQLDEAEALLKKAIELNPHSPFAHEALGKVLSEKDQLDEAEISFKKAIELNPQSAFAHEALGNLLVQKNQLDEAETLLKKAIELNSESAFAHEILGATLEQKNQLDEAEIYLKRAIELDPQSPFAHHIFAKLLIKQEQWKEAEVHIKKIIKIEPRYTPAYKLLEIILRKQLKISNSS